MPPQTLMISVAIPTYRRPAYLAQALESVAREAGEIEAPVEVVVSDNDSGDDTAEVVRAFESLDLKFNQNPQNLGAAENIIRACERCSGDYVLLLGDDDLLEAGSLGRVVDAIRARPGVGIVSGPVTHFRDGADAPGHRVSFGNDSGEDLDLDAGETAVEELFMRATMMSGLVFRREKLDFVGARRHADSLYPQMYMAGRAALESGACYLNTPVVSVRDGPEAEWRYSDDYMARGVFAMLNELTAGQGWGSAVRNRVANRRARATYSPLHDARKHSLGAYIRTVRGLASVPEYRRRPYFWMMVAALGVLGTGGIRLAKAVIRPRRPDRVR